MNIRNVFFCSAVLLIASLPMLAQGTYTQIDVPGATATACMGINAAGDITGQYRLLDGHYHGFLLSSGTYTTIDGPRAQDTYVYGINDMGQIVGTTDRGVGFVYNPQTQAFTPINYPGGHHETFPTSINNQGTIAGFFDHNQGYQGFTLTGTSYSLVVPPHSGHTFIYGITDEGKVVGNAIIITSNNEINFSFDQGSYKKIAIPHAPAAMVFAISPDGTAVAGSYDPVPTLSAGFVYQYGVLTTLEFPGNTQTAAQSINNLGAVVGQFMDADKVFHGFFWTPPADPVK